MFLSWTVLFFHKDHSDKLSEFNASGALNSACVKTAVWLASLATNGDGRKEFLRQKPQQLLGPRFYR